MERVVNYHVGMSSQPTLQITPEHVFFTLNAYQMSHALKGAIELELFTHVADGAHTVAEIAKRCQANDRGVRVLCDYLTVLNFLTKSDGGYALTPESAMFLSKRSPAYIGSAADFLLNDWQMSNYRNVADIVRKGSALEGAGDMNPENPVWVDFARSMVPMVHGSTQAVAAASGEPGKKIKVLDIAAGHGMFGISVALRNPAAEIVAVDWKNVLQVALENAARAGVMDRYRTLPGSAFEVDFATGYDVVLLPNFLHHFDFKTNVALIRKVRAALNPGGRVLTVEFVPNEDRISPPMAAAFSFMMLGATNGGDAYTFNELNQMFRDAGFSSTAIQDIQGSPGKLLVTEY
jgi:2-polyprenyl-3-methyl-5-hydroxy-6-metoxy-1,4-benzoquinol methylase